MHLVIFTLQAYDPELFSKALPCLSAIGCALSPDYTLTSHDDSWFNRAIAESEGVYNPCPMDTSRWAVYTFVLDIPVWITHTLKQHHVKQKAKFDMKRKMT
jgi:hypothetical protein